MKLKRGWQVTLEGWARQFAAWRAAVWLQKATRALAKHDWWRNRADDP